MAASISTPAFRTEPFSLLRRRSAATPPRPMGNADRAAARRARPGRVRDEGRAAQRREVEPLEEPQLLGGQRPPGIAGVGTKLGPACRKYDGAADSSRQLTAVPGER